MKNKILVVKALLLYRINGVLYFLELTRSPRKLFPSMGDLPGGKVDAGESPLVAIKREVQEETGITVPSLHELMVYDWGESGEFREHLYCAIVASQSVILSPEEHVSYRWVALDEVNQSALHPNVKKIVNDQKDRIVKLM